jgi:hypothetical protein
LDWALVKTTDKGTIAAVSNIASVPKKMQGNSKMGWFTIFKLRTFAF